MGQLPIIFFEKQIHTQEKGKRVLTHGKMSWSCTLKFGYKLCFSLITFNIF